MAKIAGTDLRPSARISEHEVDGAIRDALSKVQPTCSEMFNLSEQFKVPVPFVVSWAHSVHKIVNKTPERNRESLEQALGLAKESPDRFLKTTDTIEPLDPVAGAALISICLDNVGDNAIRALKRLCVADQYSGMVVALMLLDSDREDKIGVLGVLRKVNETLAAEVDHRFSAKMPLLAPLGSGETFPLGKMAAELRYCLINDGTIRDLKEEFADFHHRNSQAEYLVKAVLLGLLKHEDKKVRHAAILTLFDKTNGDYAELRAAESVLAKDPDKNIAAIVPGLQAMFRLRR